ncbi:hypothetical protein TBLA_0E01090 [Henningerozyma blattae CBS 6284]|uniref:Uncharacterized protein n=1 Tax=Henningerozyma blattae (strain ATCC 34711 / CBS 6284 / DSM 70876 / NBRC 10599 / NRRL Y-10934 / UCD 77-7) TaxID=1071380 RepID=I2H467_HENB6|nr:hypothetical protein TBLA_0E01090 [Tetrapisispora blattae CBS 6284]CCH61169.1 hypothetical protein TBLA_0E01090 [Tetrapisispora blattae CBS 6284]
MWKLSRHPIFNNPFRLVRSKYIHPLRLSLPSPFTFPNYLSTNANSTDDETSVELIEKLPIEVSMTGQNLRHTTAQNQLDTAKFYDLLIKEGGFTPRQSLLILHLIMQILNENFYNHYNIKFLRNMELENEEHLFHTAENELKSAVQISRDTLLNEQHLQLIKLIRDLDSLQDEINEMVINLLQNESKVAFHNQKSENTLLQQRIKLDLSDCNNKIGTEIMGNLRSDIENFRWQTTRSGLIAVLALVFSIMAGVNISKQREAPGNPTSSPPSPLISKMI